MGSGNDLVGKLIGPWRIEACIGEGGLAAVYRATHTRVGARAAIKILHGEHASDGEWIERMIVEAQLVNRIGSPHIVKIVDLLATPDHRPALVMELLEGAPLSAVLDQGPTPPAGSLIVVVLDVLDALELAHQHEVIHRDLKPSNIFVSPEGRGTLLDFGIAKLLGRDHTGVNVVQTEPGARLGTPRYMAPEQLRGEAIGPATDLYAIGEVLFEGLTGQGPYGDATGDELLRQKVAAPPRSLLTLRSDLPAALGPLLEQALALAPSARFATAAQMAAALRGVLATLPEAAFEPLALPLAPAPDLVSPTDASTAAPVAPPRPEPPTSKGKRPAPPPIGPYQLEALLGEGGAGKVYRAYDPRLRRHVALKVFHATAGHGAERFLAEARAHARLSHPNVCRIFDLGEANGTPYLAMQLLSGRTLGEAAGHLTVRERVGLIVECGRALQAVHSLGLIHRDVKPANVLVETDEHGAPHAYLTDFGLVRTVGDVGLTTSGTIVGTPRYMAPEQLSGNPGAIDARTDVYALGATMYEVLTGRPAFDGATSVELMFQIATQEPIELRRLVPSLPRDLETITLKCLRKQPGARYASTGELVDDLERWLRDEPIGARPPGLTERLRRVARRNRALVASIGVALTLGASGAGVEIVRRRQLHQETAIVDAVGRDAALAREQLRSAYLLPLHDLAPERGAAEAVVAQITGLTRGAGTTLRARLLLERGGLELDLGELQRARGTLDEASRLAPSNAEIQRRYGEAVLRLYVSQLGELDAHDDLSRVTQQRAKLAATERATGEAVRRGAARQGQDRDEGKLLDASILLAEQQFDAAIAAARELMIARPLWADAALLAAKAYALRGEQRLVSSATAAARADFEEAEQRYRAALVIARSHPEGWASLCSVGTNLVHLTSVEGKDPAADFSRARAACDTARLTNPKARGPLGTLLWALSHLADYVTDHGGDVHRLREEAEQIFVASGPLGETSPMALSAMVSINTAVADAAFVHGQDPTPYIDRCLLLLDAEAKLGHVTSHIEQNRGGLYGRRALYEAKQGRSPVANLERGIEANQRAIALDPLAFGAYGNVATSAELICEYELAFGQRCTSSIDRATTAAFALISLHAGRSLGYQRLADSFWYRMKGRLITDVDPEPLLPHLAWWSELALASKGDLAYVHVNLGDANRLVAEYRLRHHLPVDLARLAAGHEAMLAATRIDPSDPILLSYLARYELVWGEAEPAAFERHAKAAAAALERAMALDAKEPDVLLLGGQLALAQLRHGPRLDALRRRAIVARGLELVGRSLAQRPSWPLTLAVSAELEGEQRALAP